MLITLPTEKTVSEAAAALQAAVQAILATLKPTALLAKFNTPQLKAVAQEVEDTIVKIMQKAAR
jgi:predicted component of type VI protein secretion system